MVATKLQELNKQHALQTINSFLDEFKKCCNQKQQANPSHFENFLDRNFQNICNGKIIGKTSQDFLKRIQDLQKKYSRIEFEHLRDCLISGDKAIIEYDSNQTLQNGEKAVFHIIAIATFTDDRLTHWSQVSHDKHRHHA